MTLPIKLVRLGPGQALSLGEVTDDKVMIGNGRCGSPRRARVTTEQLESMVENSAGSTTGRIAGAIALAASGPEGRRIVQVATVGPGYPSIVNALRRAAAADYRL